MIINNLPHNLSPTEIKLGSSFEPSIIDLELKIGHLRIEPFKLGSGSAQSKLWLNRACSYRKRAKLDVISGSKFRPGLIRPRPRPAYDLLVYTPNTKAGYKSHLLIDGIALIGYAYGYCLVVVISYFITTAGI